MPALTKSKSVEVPSSASSPLKTKVKPSTYVPSARAKEVMHDSFRAVLATSVEYVASALRKKFKQFMMCVMTVFLTVSFITFLNGVGQLAPIVTLQSAVFTAGDNDMIIMGKSGTTKMVRGNNNYYNDENEFFNAPFLS